MDVWVKYDDPSLIAYIAPDDLFQVFINHSFYSCENFTKWKLLKLLLEKLWMDANRAYTVGIFTKRCTFIYSWSNVVSTTVKTISVFVCSVWLFEQRINHYRFSFIFACFERLLLFILLLFFLSSYFLFLLAVVIINSFLSGSRLLLLYFTSLFRLLL